MLLADRRSHHLQHPLSTTTKISPRAMRVPWIMSRRRRHRRLLNIPLAGIQGGFPPDKHHLHPLHHQSHRGQNLPTRKQLLLDPLLAANHRQLLLLSHVLRKTDGALCALAQGLLTSSQTRTTLTTPVSLSRTRAPVAGKPLKYMLKTAGDQC
jgi:hypothetical protein